MAFRSYNKEKNEVISFFKIFGESSLNLRQIVNNTSSPPEKLSDPKFVSLNGKPFLTFNTGYSTTFNDIFLAEYKNGHYYPYKCNLPGRMKVEKNWAFFYKNNDLFAIYSINPLVILKAIKKENYKIEFKKIKTSKTFFDKNISIGTQLVEIDNYHYFIAHKKYYFGKKRIYLGVPFRIDIKNDTLIIEKSNKLLTHSYYSLLGSLKKLNKNLISCSYFSGIGYIDDKVIISYGINDVDFNVIEMNANELKSYFGK